MIKLLDQLRVDLKAEAPNRVTETAEYKNLEGKYISAVSRIGIIEAKERMMIETMSQMNDKNY